MTLHLDDDGLVERLEYRVENPSAWDCFDQGASDLMRQAADAITRIKAERDGLAKALSELANSDLQLIVREIVAGWNGEGREGGPFIRHPDMLGASIPATCGMVYALDDAFTLARATLSTGAPDGK